jgi:hypothetical protein
VERVTSSCQPGCHHSNRPIMLEVVVLPAADHNHLHRLLQVCSVIKTVGTAGTFNSGWRSWHTRQHDIPKGQKCCR